jgi:hypothetical protein
MAYWTTSFQGSPANTSPPRTGYSYIQETRTEFQARIANEHSSYPDGTGGATTADFLHKPGSLAVFVQASAPTTRLDGTPLVAGLLWKDTTNNRLKVYSGSSWLEFVDGRFVRIAFSNSPAPLISIAHGLGSDWTKVRYAIAMVYDQNAQYTIEPAGGNAGLSGGAYIANIDSTYVSIADTRIMFFRYVAGTLYLWVVP